MVSAAKNGKWSEVYSILDLKRYLIHCIPEERAWGVLHHAACHKDKDAVRKLLDYPTCDSEIKTKQDRSNQSGPGKTPKWIAERLKPDKEITEILTGFCAKKGKKGLEVTYQLTSPVKMEKRWIEMVYLYCFVHSRITNKHTTQVLLLHISLSETF